VKDGGRTGGHVIPVDPGRCREAHKVIKRFRIVTTAVEARDGSEGAR
jgi:hypothetical protein